MRTLHATLALGLLTSTLFGPTGKSSLNLKHGRDFLENSETQSERCGLVSYQRTMAITNGDANFS
jgi:hypothetical protein